jgi:hypothetical protein
VLLRAGPVVVGLDTAGSAGRVGPGLAGVGDGVVAAVWPPPAGPLGLAAGEELLQEAKTTARTVAPRAPQITRTPPVKLKPS